MSLEKTRTNWNAFAKHDPMWAILSDPQKLGNKWDIEEFFATGEREISEVMAYLGGLAIPFGSARALDFGCGLGRVTQAMPRFFDLVDGLDISPIMIEKAMRLNRWGSRVTYQANFSTMLPFSAASFDFLYSMIVLQHMESALVRQYMTEFVRVIRPGGIALFQMPSLCLVSRGTKFESPVDTPEGTFTIDMNVLPKDQVLETVTSHGGLVVAVTPDHKAGPKFESFVYCVTKG